MVLEAELDVNWGRGVWVRDVGLMHFLYIPEQGYKRNEADQVVVRK